METPTDGIVIVPTTELQDQWHASLVERLPGVRIGRLGGGRQDDLDTCDVLVAIVLDREVISSPQVDENVACEAGIAGGSDTTSDAPLAARLRPHQRLLSLRIHRTH